MERHSPTPSERPAAVERWLAAERGGSEAAAEAALAALLADLDRPAPPAGFAERVMLRAAAAGVLAAAVPRASLVRSPWARAAVVALLLGAALALAAVLGALRPLTAGLGLGDLLAGLAGLAGALGTALTGLIEATERLEVLRRAVAAALESPAVVLVLGLCLALAAGGFRLLHDILQRERSWSYVDPI
jgi:hypothetical protein